VAREQGLVPLVHGCARGRAGRAVDPGVALAGRGQPVPERPVGPGGVRIVDEAVGVHGAGEGVAVPDAPALGDQPLAGRDGEVAPGGEEVRFAGRRYARADTDDAHVVDGASAGALVQVERVQDDDPALGLGGPSADQEVVADEDVDAVVPAGERAVADLGNGSGQSPGTHGPSFSGSGAACACPEPAPTTRAGARPATSAQASPARPSRERRAATRCVMTCMPAGLAVGPRRAGPTYRMRWLSRQ